MKKSLQIGLAVFTIGCGNAYGLSSTDIGGVELKCWLMCTGKQMDSTTCNTLLCNTCKDSELSGLNGIITIQKKEIISDCSGSLGKCSCKTTKSYKCASGYYGTATSASAGCTQCPENATCTGGNGSTFVCNRGYYKNGTLCTRCPSSGGIYGTTSAPGATSVRECYLPAGTTGSDSTGSFTYTGDCYYVN